MTRPIHPACRIDDRSIDDAIAALVHLRTGPERGGDEWHGVLLALDKLIGNDVLAEALADYEPVECLCCGTDCGGRCDQLHDDWVSLDLVERIGPTQVAA